MITVDEMQRLLLGGGDVLGADGKKIGSLGQLFLDAGTGEPAWVTVVTGLFGTSESFVPLTGAVARGDDVEVPYDKDRVKHAPRIDSADGSLSPAEERDLYRHYGLLHDDVPVDDDVPRDDDGHGDDDVPRAEARDEEIPDDGAPGGGTALPVPPGVPPTVDPPPPLASGGATALPAAAAATETTAPAGPDDRTEDEAGPTSRSDDGMVLRVERARVIGSERVPTERVRMRRYTVTENRTISVPVTREEYRVEYEPAGGAGEPLPAPDEGTHHPRHAADPDHPDDRTDPDRRDDPDHRDDRDDPATGVRPASS